MEEIIKLIFGCVLVCIFWITNRWRGADDERPKLLLTKTMVYGLECLTFGSMFAFFSLDVKLTAILCGAYFLTHWLCMSFGWGKYFMHNNNNYAEREFWPAYKLTNLIHGIWDKEMPERWVKNWKTIAMTFRFLLTFGLIKVPVLAYLVGNWWCLLFGIVVYSLSGLIYRFSFDYDEEIPGDPVNSAEWLIGGLNGLFMASLLWTVAW